MNTDSSEQKIISMRLDRNTAMALEKIKEIENLTHDDMQRMFIDAFLYLRSKGKDWNKEKAPTKQEIYKQLIPILVKR